MPSSAPLPVRVGVAVALTMPKSATLTRPSRLTSRLAGLMSRCTRPPRMRGRQRLAHPAADLGGSAGLGDFVAAQGGGQGLARHVLHHDVMDVALGAAVEDGHDVGVAQGGGGAGLVAEPFHEGGVLIVGWAEHFDRHHLLEHPVGGPVHAGHAPGAGQGAKLVAARQGLSLACHRGRNPTGRMLSKAKSWLSYPSARIGTRRGCSMSAAHPTPEAHDRTELVPHLRNEARRRSVPDTHGPA